MKRLALVLVLAGCTAATEPVAGDRAWRNGFGGWDVRLESGSGCSLLANDATTAAGAIALCRYWLGGVPV